MKLMRCLEAVEKMFSGRKIRKKERGPTASLFFLF